MLDGTRDDGMVSVAEWKVAISGASLSSVAKRTGGFKFISVAECFVGIWPRSATRVASKNFHSRATMLEAVSAASALGVLAEPGALGRSTARARFLPVVPGTWSRRA